MHSSLEIRYYNLRWYNKVNRRGSGDKVRKMTNSEIVNDFVVCVIREVMERYNVEFKGH